MDTLASYVGGGILSGGRLRIRYDRSEFRKLTFGKFDEKHPHISSPRQAGVFSQDQEWRRYQEASKLDSEAAIKVLQ